MDDRVASAHIASGREAYLLRLVEMAGHAQRHFCIFSLNLERSLYSDERLVVPLQKFLLSHDHARLRVLVRTAEGARSGNRLVELGRRLSSRVEFRELLPENRLIECEYAVADERSLLLRESPQELDARYYADAPLLARQQRRDFDQLWQDAVPAAEFRDLKL